MAYGDGNDLLSSCNTATEVLGGEENQKNYSEIGYCFGFMQGVTSLNKLYEVGLGNNAFFCSPDKGIKNSQAARIVVGFLKAHPELLHQNESILAVQAFQEAYPCEQ